MNERYRRAYVEVLEIINNFSEEEYNKIPKEKIEFYESNKDKDYKFTFDPSKDLNEQNVSKEAKAIIVTLFRDYFATEEQKEKLKQILQENEQKANQEKEKQYNPDNMFTSEEADKEENKETAMIVRNENIFTKIWSFIKSFFNKKGGKKNEN